MASKRLVLAYNGDYRGTVENFFGANLRFQVVKPAGPDGKLTDWAQHDIVIPQTSDSKYWPLAYYSGFTLAIAYDEDTNGGQLVVTSAFGVSTGILYENSLCVYKIRGSFNIASMERVMGIGPKNPGLSIIRYGKLNNIGWDTGSSMSIAQNLPTQKWGPWQSMTVRDINVNNASHTAPGSVPVLLKVPLKFGHIFAFSTRRDPSDTNKKILGLATIPYSDYDKAQDSDKVYWDLYSINPVERTFLFNQPDIWFDGHKDIHIFWQGTDQMLYHMTMEVDSRGVPVAESGNKIKSRDRYQIPQANIKFAPCVSFLGEHLYVFYQNKHSNKMSYIFAPKSSLNSWSQEETMDLDMRTENHTTAPDCYWSKLGGVSAVTVPDSFF